MDWIKHIPFINRKYRDTRLNNAKNVPWGNQDLKTNIPNSPSTQQLRDVYKQRVRQNIRYGTPSDPAFPWQERTRMPTNKPTPPKGIPDRVSPKQLKGLINDLKAAKPPMVLKIPLPKGITIPKIPINIPPGLVKAAGVGGSIYQLASEAPRTWRALESSGVDIWSIITSGAGLIPQISSQPWWQEFAKAIVERKRELQQQQGLIRPSSTTEVQPATYPFEGGQSAVTYKVEYRITQCRWNSSGGLENCRYLEDPDIYARNLPGPISGMTRISPGINPIFESEWYIEHAQGRERVAANRQEYYQSVGDVYSSNVIIKRVTRLDGQPDTGGNPPPTTAPITSEPWIPVPVTPIPVSDLIPEPVTTPTTTTEEEPKLPSPFGGIPFLPYSIPIPSEGVNEGLAPSQTPLTPNSPNVSDQTAPTKRITYKPVSPIPTGGETITNTTYAPGSDTTTGTQIDTETGTETNTKTKKETFGKLPTLPTVPPLFTPITNGSKPSNEIAPKPTESVKQTPQPSNCELNNSCTLNKIGDLQAGQNTLLDKVNTGLNAADLLQNSALLRIIDNKLGPQMNGGISGALGRAWKAAHMDKALNALNTVLLFHNAAMLSRNLAVTLGDTASTVLNAFGVKDEDNQLLDVNQVIGKKVTELAKNVLGAEVYEDLSDKWKAASRILASASRMLDIVRSMIYSMINGLEIIGRWIALIGNGAQREGLFSDGTFPWANEYPNFKNPFFNYVEQLERLEDAASSVNELASEVVEGKEMIEEFRKEKKTLNDELDKGAKELELKEEDEVKKSENPNIKDEDLLEAPEED